MKKMISLMLIAALLVAPSFLFPASAAEDPVTGEWFPLGDVDGDGFVTANDARMALRISGRFDPMPAPGTRQFIAANVVDIAEGKITAADARMILRVSGRLDSFNDKPNDNVKKDATPADILAVIQTAANTVRAQNKDTPKANLITFRHSYESRPQSTPVCDVKLTWLGNTMMAIAGDDLRKEFYDTLDDLKAAAVSELSAPIIWDSDLDSYTNESLYESKSKMLPAVGNLTTSGRTPDIKEAICEYISNPGNPSKNTLIVTIILKDETITNKTNIANTAHGKVFDLSKALDIADIEEISPKMTLKLSGCYVRYKLRVPEYNLKGIANKSVAFELVSAEYRAYQKLDISASLMGFANIRINADISEKQFFQFPWPQPEPA